MNAPKDYTVFASGPHGRVRLGPFDAVTVLAEVRAMRAKHWTGIRLLNAATKIERDLAEMEADLVKEADLGDQ